MISRKPGVVVVLIAAATTLLACIVPPVVAQPTPPRMTEADVHVSQAILDFEDRRYDQVLASLQRALQIDPDHVEALYYTGASYMALQRPAEALPPLERARQLAPQNAAVLLQLGLAYFAERQYDRATPLLEEVFRTTPTLDNLGYYVGFLRYRDKNYRGALAAFDAGRTTTPELEQLTRLYKGLALGVLGLPARAKAEVDEALRVAPSSPLTGPLERLRDTVGAAPARDKRLAIDLRLGVFFDDNVPVIPDRDRREPLVALLRQPRHESVGELAAARIEYAWYRDEAWDATVGYSFFTTYNNDLPSFNVMDHVLSSGVSYRTALGGKPVQFGAQYAFDFLLLDEEEFLRRHSVTVFGAVAASERHLSQLLVRYQRKDFAEPSPRPVDDEIRDANNWMVGAVHVLRFAADKHFLKAGYQFDYEDTSGRNYTYRGHRLLAGALYTLPWWQIRLRYDFDVHLRDYVHNNSLLPTTAPGTKRRQDEELTNTVRAELPLPWNLTLAAEYLNTNNRSTLAPFSYTRNVVSLILSWSY